MSFHKCPICEQPLKAQVCPKHGFMCTEFMEGYERGLEDGLNSRNDTDRLDDIVEVCRKRQNSTINKLGQAILNCKCPALDGATCFYKDLPRYFPQGMTIQAMTAEAQRLRKESEK